VIEATFATEVEGSAAASHWTRNSEQSTARWLRLATKGSLAGTQ